MSKPGGVHVLVTIQSSYGWCISRGLGLKEGCTKTKTWEGIQRAVHGLLRWIYGVLTSFRTRLSENSINHFRQIAPSLGYQKGRQCAIFLSGRKMRTSFLFCVYIHQEKKDKELTSCSTGFCEVSLPKQNVYVCMCVSVCACTFVGEWDFDGGWIVSSWRCRIWGMNAGLVWYYRYGCRT